MRTSFLNKEYIPNWLLFTTAFSINLWALSWFDLKFYQYFHLLIMSFLIWNIFKYSKKKLTQCFSKPFVIALCLLPLLSIYSCKILHEQSITASLTVWRMHLGWLLYFVLWYKKINEQQCIKIICYIGIIYALITLIQQATFPFAPFGSRTVGSGYAENLFNGTVEKRMGFYRFGIEGLQYAVAAFFICIAKKINYRHKKILILGIILSIIACGNRQTMASVFAAYCYYLLYKNKTKHRIVYIILICLTILILYAFRETLFGSLANVSDDLESGRSFSYIYYFNEYISNPLSIFCGNGVGHESSAYGSEPIYFNNKEVILSDIGMLGTLYYWGIIYVLTYFAAIFRFLGNKYLDIHIKAIMLAPILVSWISSPLWEFKGMFFQALLFYYCDINIYNNKIRKQKLNENSVYTSPIRNN